MLRPRLRMACPRQTASKRLRLLLLRLRMTALRMTTIALRRRCGSPCARWPEQCFQVSGMSLTGKCCDLQVCAALLYSHSQCQCLYLLMHI